MKRVINLTTISMFILFALITQTVHGVSFSGVKGGTSDSKTITTLNDNDISASAASGWTFQTANASPSAYKNASCSVFGASTSTKMGTFNFVNFTVSMWGRITGSGSGSGPDTYSLSATRLSTFYWIDAVNDKTIIPKGGSETYSGKETMSNFSTGSKNSDWEYALSGQSPVDAGSGTSFAAPTTLVAGNYTITGSPVMWAEVTSDSKNLKVVEVEKIETTAYSTTITSTTASPGNDESICTDSVSLTFTATPKPSGAWPVHGNPEVSYPEWYVGDSKVKDGGSYTFNPTGKSTGTYTVKAKCGTSVKAINVHVVDCHYMIGVRTPASGAIELTYNAYGVLTGVDVGHTAWQLHVTPSAAINAVPLKPYTSLLRKYVGFYSNSGVTAALTGIVVAPTPTLHVPDTISGKLKSYDISLANLVAGAAYTKSINTTSGDYRLGTYLTAVKVITLISWTQPSTRNCTSTALDAGSASSVTTLPSASGTWRGVFAGLSIDFRGEMPYILYPLL